MPKQEQEQPKARSRLFQAKVIRAFAGYIRTCGLVVADKQLLAAMLCDVAPKFNSAFDAERFLYEAGLLEGDALKAYFDRVHQEAEQRLDESARKRAEQRQNAKGAK